MKISHSKLVITDDIRVLLREVTPTTQKGDIPFWKGIMVYHPSTGQYYATWAKNPLAYYSTLRTRFGPKWDKVALTVHQMLEHNTEFQFFVLPIHGRPTVEQWMALQGKKRVATMRGDAAEQIHVLFQVYSPFNKVTRFVCAPGDTPKDVVIKKANESMLRWLGSPAKQNKHERDTMRIALRTLFSNKTNPFETTAQVIRTNQFANVKHNEFTSRVTQLNLQAIRNFILDTTGRTA
ncbi:hypothetical protein [Ralstonia phage RP31]|uniref:Uncharacterized protein n=2 Tax=Ripduovirus RP12 TaxID=2560700 RepID=A0A1L7N102_9CAUD|nr:hypothetical protein FDH28_gp234 [Ralstonia phage RP12]BAW19161.1 hypothetical protein [Ralstonia phage RP12]BAW19447.1 hypothetical protein [Ralstonia phage RP31]